jgi:hypothetical protein
MSVTNIITSEELAELIKQDKVVAIVYIAPWAGVSVSFVGKIQRLAENYPTAVFATCDPEISSVSY